MPKSGSSGDELYGEDTLYGLPETAQFSVTRIDAAGGENDNARAGRGNGVTRRYRDRSRNFKSVSPYDSVWKK